MTKINKFNFTIIILVKMENTQNRLCMEPNHGTQDLEIDTLTIIHVLCWLNFINIGGDCSPCVKSLMDMELLL
jgi:hypothetical protein